MALTNHMLNNANQGPAFMLNPSIDPQLKMQPIPQILSTPQNTQANLAGMWLIFLPLRYMTDLSFPALHIFARISINNKVTHDIEFEADIPSCDFFDCVCIVMELDLSKAKLGWKTNDNPKHSLAHQLASDEDITNTFGFLIKLIKTHYQKYSCKFLI